MQFYIKQIQVNQILHLNEFTISLGDSPKHLLITGQNGSGKTQLIKAIAEHLQLVCNDKSANRLNIENTILSWKSAINDTTPEHQKRQYQQAIKNLEDEKKLYLSHHHS